MGTLEHRVDLARQPGEVWEVVGNFDEDERWRNVQVMRSDPSGPARAGTRTHEVLRFMGSTYVTDATVTHVEPGRRLLYEGAGDGTTVRGYRRVEDTSGGTRFVEGIEIELSGPMRVLEPLLARLYGRRIKSEIQTLKSLLEG
jgi:Polyketide cyclase / dehydrase and lipid transport